MDKIEKNKFFLFIGYQKFIFSILDNNNQDLFEKEFPINEISLEKIYDPLEQFLDQNVIELEKKFKYYIKEINLILDINEFVNVKISTTNNFNYLSQQLDNNSNYLFNIKNDVMKNMQGYDLIHMIIKKYLVDGKEYPSMPTDNIQKNVYLEIQFILSKHEITQKLKKIFSKYQILVKNISCFNYVNSFKKSDLSNIFDLSDKLSNGYNQKEIIFLNKTRKNIGFFEKFFNFFR